MHKIGCNEANYDNPSRSIVLKIEFFFNTQHINDVDLPASLS